MVTHSTTNPPVRSLSTGERTGSSVLSDLWPYVTGVGGLPGSCTPNRRRSRSGGEVITATQGRHGHPATTSSRPTSARTAARGVPRPRVAAVARTRPPLRARKACARARVCVRPLRGRGPARPSPAAETVRPRSAPRQRWRVYESERIGSQPVQVGGRLRGARREPRGARGARRGNVRPTRSPLPLWVERLDPSVRRDRDASPAAERPASGIPEVRRPPPWIYSRGPFRSDPRPSRRVTAGPPKRSSRRGRSQGGTPANRGPSWASARRFLVAVYAGPSGVPRGRSLDRSHGGRQRPATEALHRTAQCRQRWSLWTIGRWLPSHLDTRG